MKDLLLDEIWYNVIASKLDPIALRHLSMTCRYAYALLHDLIKIPYEEAVIGFASVEMATAAPLNMFFKKGWNVNLYAARYWNLPVLEKFYSPAYADCVLAGVVKRPSLPADFALFWNAHMTEYVRRPHWDTWIIFALSAFFDLPGLPEACDVDIRASDATYPNWFLNYFDLSVPLLDRMEQTGIALSTRHFESAFLANATCSDAVLDWMYARNNAFIEGEPCVPRVASHLRWQLTRRKSPFTENHLCHAIRLSHNNKVQWELVLILLNQGVKPGLFFLVSARDSDVVSPTEFELLRRYHWEPSAIDITKIRDWRTHALASQHTPDKLALLLYWFCPDDKRALIGPLIARPRERIDDIAQLLRMIRVRFNAGFGYDFGLTPDDA